MSEIKFKIQNSKFKVQVGMIIIILIVLILIGGFSLWGKGLFQIIKERDKIQEFVLSFGNLAPLMMVLIQAVQIIVAPLPGQFVAILSGYLFGTFKGTVVSMTGVISGAMVALFIARIIGRRLIQYLVPEKKLSRFDTYLLKKGHIFFFLLFLVPNPIGDVAYYLAGLTKIPVLPYILLVLIGRLPSNILNNLIGARASSFSLQEWLILITISLLLLFIYYLNKSRIERIFVKNL